MLDRRDGVPGMVASIQSFGSLIQWHPHAHCLVSDGVLLPGGDFVPMPPYDEELERLLTETFRRLVLDALVKGRGLTLDALDLFLITSPVLWLDDKEHRERLAQTVEELRPKLLLLDPLVHLHRQDENDVRAVSKLLGHLRALNRTFVRVQVVAAGQAAIWAASATGCGSRQGAA